MNSKKRISKVIKGVLATLPAIPFMMRRRRKSSMVLPMVLGGIGMALLGGVAALMLLSPRTRHRALGAAKDAYGRFNDRRRQRRIGEDERGRVISEDVSNGLVGEPGAGPGYTTSGL